MLRASDHARFLPVFPEVSAMKRYVTFLFLFSFGVICVGCGGPTSDPVSEAQQQEENNSAEYEKDMMGEE